MIKISISGEASTEQREALDKFVATAIECYLDKFPKDAVKTNWRKEREKKAQVTEGASAETAAAPQDVEGSPTGEESQG